MVGIAILLNKEDIEIIIVMTNVPCAIVTTFQVLMVKIVILKEVGAGMAGNIVKIQQQERIEIIIVSKDLLHLVVMIQWVRKIALKCVTVFVQSSLSVLIQQDVETLTARVPVTAIPMSALGEAAPQHAMRLVGLLVMRMGTAARSAAASGGIPPTAAAATANATWAV